RRRQRRCGMNTPTPTITPELRALLRRVKLGRCLDTLPERLALATGRQMGHAEFLELVLADEVTRREPTSAAIRARAAGHDTEMRKLLRVDLLILDDFALAAMDALDTADIYETIVERHRAASTIVTSNREPIEWLGQMSDALLAQSAIDRLQSAAYELVLDGDSYRQRQKPGLDVGATTARPRRRRRP